MEQMKGNLIINLVTTKDEFTQLIRSCIEETSIVYPPPKHEPYEEELLTVKQNAQFFQVSTTTIHNWKNSGVLPFVKVKSRIRFRKSEMLALYERRTKHDSLTNKKSKRI